eukprot:6198168-Pleurochrysis_carterae.AAC.2
MAAFAFSNNCGAVRAGSWEDAAPAKGAAQGSGASHGTQSGLDSGKCRYLHKSKHRGQIGEIWLHLVHNKHRASNARVHGSACQVNAMLNMLPTAPVVLLLLECSCLKAACFLEYDGVEYPPAACYVICFAGKQAQVLVPPDHPALRPLPSEVGPAALWAGARLRLPCANAVRADFAAVMACHQI